MFNYMVLDEQNYSSILNKVKSGPVAVCLLDEKGVIIQANPAVEQLFDYPIQDVKGKELSALFSQKYRSKRYKDAIKDFFESNRVERSSIEEVLMGMRWNRTSFPIEATLATVDDDKDEQTRLAILQAYTPPEHPPIKPGISQHRYYKNVHKNIFKAAKEMKESLEQILPIVKNSNDLNQQEIDLVRQHTHRMITILATINYKG